MDNVFKKTLLIFTDRWMQKKKIKLTYFHSLICFIDQSKVLVLSLQSLSECWVQDRNNGWDISALQATVHSFLRKNKTTGYDCLKGFLLCIGSMAEITGSQVYINELVNAKYCIIPLLTIHSLIVIL